MGCVVEHSSKAQQLLSRACPTLESCFPARYLSSKGGISTPKQDSAPFPSQLPAWHIVTISGLFAECKIHRLIIPLLADVSPFRRAEILAGRQGSASPEDGSLPTAVRQCCTKLLAATSVPALLMSGCLQLWALQKLCPKAKPPRCEGKAWLLFAPQAAGSAPWGWLCHVAVGTALQLWEPLVLRVFSWASL